MPIKLESTPSLKKRDTTVKSLFCLLLLFLPSCIAATPQINLTAGDMSMEVKSKAPAPLSVAYSPDGKTIVSGSNDGLLRLWDVSLGKEIRKFEGHTGRVESVAFSPDGRYVVSGSNDTTAKLWDVTTGKEIRTFRGHSKNVVSVAFSPDGRSVLSASQGLMTADEINLWDVSTGKEIWTSPKTDSISVAISSDGRYALTGGRNGMQLLELATGRDLISFLTERDLHTMIYGVDLSSDGRYALAVTSRSSGLFGIAWVVELYDVLTGRKIREILFSSSIAGIPSASFSNDSRYIMSGGTNNVFEFWDVATGLKIRELPLSSSFMPTYRSSISFSPDGKYLVTNRGDASLRINKVSTGEELATMIGFENGEWVVTTSEGYYNSSPNGDKYVGIKVDGEDYTIEQLHESFFRPDLVSVALSGGSLREFKKSEEIKPPPVVSVVDTPRMVDNDEAIVTLKITDVGGGIGDIRLYINGSAIMLDNQRGISFTATKNKSLVHKKYSIRLTNGLNVLRAIAFNGDNTMQSADAVHEITASYISSYKPSLYALVVGINEYKNPRLQLNFAAADAELFANTLEKSGTGLFEKIIVKKITTKQETTNENIIRELKMLRNLKPDDLFVFYVASHGTVDDGEYFLVTSNVGSTSTAKLKRDALSQTTLKELIANIPTTKKLIVIDTCSAGALGSAIQTAMLTRGMSEDTAMKVLSRAVGSTILSASTGVQEALEGYQGHGLFTYIIAEGLKGKADADKDGFIKTIELANYVDDEVPALAEKVFQKAQYPIVSPSGQAFPVGRVQ